MPVGSGQLKVYDLNVRDCLKLHHVETHEVHIESTPFASGGCRQAFYCYFRTESGQWGSKMVAKKYIRDEAFLEDYVCAHMAYECARAFNLLKPPKPIDYLVPNQIFTMNNVNYSIEKFLQGSWLKHNNIFGMILSDRRTPNAFSHFSYIFSCYRYIILDVQGVDDTFTDPAVVSVEQGKFGYTDTGRKGIRDFFRNHVCNEVCHNLKLPPFNEHNIRDDVHWVDHPQPPIPQVNTWPHAEKIQTVSQPPVKVIDIARQRQVPQAAAPEYHYVSGYSGAHRAHSAHAGHSSTNGDAALRSVRQSTTFLSSSNTHSTSSHGNNSNHAGGSNTSSKTMIFLQGEIERLLRTSTYDLKRLMVDQKLDFAATISKKELVSRLVLHFYPDFRSQLLTLLKDVPTDQSTSSLPSQRLPSPNNPPLVHHLDPDYTQFQQERRLPMARRTPPPDTDTEQRYPTPTTVNPQRSPVLYPAQNSQRSSSAEIPRKNISPNITRPNNGTYLSKTPSPPRSTIYAASRASSQPPAHSPPNTSAYTPYLSHSPPTLRLSQTERSDVSHVERPTSRSDASPNKSRGIPIENETSSLELEANNSYRLSDPFQNTDGCLSPSVDLIPSLSTKELRAQLYCLGVDFTHCVEKVDLERVLKVHLTRKEADTLELDHEYMRRVSTSSSMHSDPSPPHSPMDGQGQDSFDTIKARNTGSPSGVSKHPQSANEFNDVRNGGGISSESTSTLGKGATPPPIPVENGMAVGTRRLWAYLQHLRKTMFLKYGKTGSPHRRLLQVTTRWMGTHYDIFLTWHDTLENTEQHGEIALDTLTSIQLGCAAAKFQRHIVDSATIFGRKGQTHRSALCFSLQFPKRSLDLLALSQHEFDMWVEGFKQIAEYNSGRS